MQQVWSKNSIVNTTTRAINVDDTVTAGLDNAKGTFGVNFSGSSARTGTSDAFNLMVVNGSGTATVASNFVTITDAAAIDNTFEVANIMTAGAASNVNLGGAVGDMTLRTVNVTGDGALTLAANGNFADLRTVDASGMTGGGLKIDASGTTQQNFAFTGSGFDDRVVILGATANAANTMALNGGAGKNTLGIAAITDFVGAGQATLRATINTKATNFQVLEATAANVTLLKANDFTNINEFLFSTANAGAAGLAITGVETGDKFVFSNTNTRDADVVTLSGAVAGQSTTVELEASAANVANLIATGAGNNALTVNDGITSVTINSVGTNANPNEISAATTVAAIDNVTATNFMVTGTHNLSIGAALGLAAPLGFTNAVSLEASDLTLVQKVLFRF